MLPRSKRDEMAVSRPNGIGNLPADVTSFVGRRPEVLQVRAMLADFRLVALTGMGGVGKTRLALRVAGGATRAFRDGVWFVELAPVHDPELVSPAVAAALGIEAGGAAVSALASHLAEREALLVLDNCEHLVDSCAVTATELLRLCPGVRIVVTGREPLRVDGEHIFAVPPLAVPERGMALSLQEFAEYPAVRLLVERAKAATPGFTLTEENRVPIFEICRRLDGVPLALELAATRLRALAPAQLQQRLNDRFALLTGGDRSALPRQQTLRALIDWSYDLCTPTERIVWKRLSVFQGVFGLTAAETVCSGGEIPDDEIFSALAGLVDKSIVTTTDDDGVLRYQLSETLSEYGAERLNESERARLQRRHVDWYAESAAAAESRWFSEAQVAQLAALRREHSNLRAALNYSLADHDRIGVGLAMAAALRFHWSISGCIVEGGHWLDRILAAYPGRDLIRLKALRVRAWLATLMGDPVTTDRMLSEAAELAGTLHDITETGYVTQLRGLVALFRGDSARSTTLFTQAYQIHKAVGDEFGWTYDEIGSALAAVQLGDTQRASNLLEPALRVSKARGAHWTTSFGLFADGLLACRQGDYAHSRELQQESIRLRLTYDDRRNIGLNLEALAWCAVGEDEAIRAAQLFGAARAIEGSVGAPLRGWQPLFDLHREYEPRARQVLGEESFQLAEEEGRCLDFHDVVSLALRETTGSSSAPPLDADEASITALTRREREVAELLADGLTNREIAATLVISTRTVDTHVEHVLTKLNFKSRTQVATWVARQRSGDDSQR